jgi:predicted ATPase
MVSKEHSFSFTVLPHGKRAPKSAQSRAFLLTDNWDDWFKYSTLYVLVVFDEDGVEHDVGQVKIGEFAMRTDQRRPELPDSFELLGNAFFSLGQDDSYYEELNKLGTRLRDHLLKALRDVAADLELFDRALEEDVTTTSLLRSVSESTVRGQFHRLARGGARLSTYKFTYRAPRQVATKSKPVTVEFEVLPESQPPTNIHVIIGRNGVGKTYLLHLMTRALVEAGASPKQVGAFAFGESDEPNLHFANLVSVTFSAFDPFEPLPPAKSRAEGIHYSYIGLKRFKRGDTLATAPKSHRMLAKEFVDSMRVCSRGAKLARWQKALENLEADPIFKEADVAGLARASNDDNFEKSASSLFNKLSSGHKIVLLTTTKLVETVEERSLVLLDEPEAHLHPPLLSAFVRSLSDLLIDRNGVAIVATHSPVILQEVPRSCVWKLRRSGHEVDAERPDIETFGENVGILTREVFGFEVTHAGFHKLIQDAANTSSDFDAALGRFDEQLGAEGRAILRSLIAERDSRDGEG